MRRPAFESCPCVSLQVTVATYVDNSHLDARCELTVSSVNDALDYAILESKGEVAACLRVLRMCVLLSSGLSPMLSLQPLKRSNRKRIEFFKAMSPCEPTLPCGADCLADDQPFLAPFSGDPELLLGRALTVCSFSVGLQGFMYENFAFSMGVLKVRLSTDAPTGTGLPRIAILGMLHSFARRMRVYCVFS